MRKKGKHMRKQLNKLKRRERRNAKVLRENGYTRNEFRNPYKRKKISYKQHSSAKAIVNDLDTMAMAKAFPGKFDSKYVASMNTTPLATFKAQTGFSLNEVATWSTNGHSNGSINSPGTGKYLLIAYCPALSTQVAPRVNIPAFTSVSRGTRISGLTALQTDSLSTVFGAYDFIQNGECLPMSSMFGSDMEGFSEKGFVWAGKTEFRLIAPLANIAGRIWKGRLLYGQLFDAIHDTNGTTWAQGGGIELSIQQLINLAQEVKLTPTASFEIQSSIVNNNIPYDDTPTLPTANSFGGLAHLMNAGDVAGEVIEYIVLQTGAMNITSGALMPYTLAATFSGNFAFWPKATDALANNLFRVEQNNVRYEKQAIDSVLDNVETSIGSTSINHPESSPLLDSIANTVPFDFGSAIDEVSSIFNQTLDLLPSNETLGSLATFASIAGTLLDVEDPIVIAYIGTARRGLDAVYGLGDTGDPVLDELLQRIIKDISLAVEYCKDKPDMYEIHNEPIPIPPVDSSDNSKLEKDFPVDFRQYAESIQHFKRC